MIVDNTFDPSKVQQLQKEHDPDTKLNSFPTHEQATEYSRLLKDLYVDYYTFTEIKKDEVGYYPNGSEIID